MPLSMLLGLPTFVLAGGGIAVAVLLFAMWRELREEGAGARSLRSGGRRTASGVAAGITVGRAGAFSGFLVIQTLIAEVLNIGWSVLDILGPLVGSNLLAIGLGSLSLAGIIPMSPWWYAGVSLMILGIAMSSAGEAFIDRYAGAEA